MKKIFVFVVFVMLTYTLFSQDKKYLYSGGMLLFQPGYTMMQNPHQDINTLGFGIGGMLRFYIKDHLTLGILGGSQKTSYTSQASENSYVSLGYGGLFVGYTKLWDKFRFCASVSVGKGRIKNLHVQSQNSVILTDAYYYEYPATIAYPMLSLDYFISKKIVFTAQAIYLSASYNQNDLYFCPVLQFGVLFNR